MKVLLLVLVAAFVGAQADFVRLNLDNEISALVSEINSPRHIRDTNPIARATQTVLGQQLEEKLNDVTDKINEALEKTHHVSKALLEQAQELTEQLKALGGKYLADAKAILSSLKDKLSGFTGWVAGIFGKRDLFENFEQELLDETVALVLADRGVLDWWANLKDSLSKLLGRFGSKFSDLSAFVQQYAGDLWGKVRGHFDNVKLVAQEYLEHAKNASLAVTEEVVEFLRPYKQDLGSLWGQVVNAANNVKHIALTGTTPPPEPGTRFL
ncbi:uncharacterized protein LOC106166863 [Lingula anatina]|uniref:Uncharacterized protein LOC106166863 n=1 Tax=Lingula anatina TaxID=7574 RepID=A0A1S3IS00_LINAN|nr:uncharacterized protein LOC106166863 [Lingula anatina]|eukprot:XP_013400982.1 uncharacterized protein LOC106166863 [Lingula anatina]